MERLVRVNQEIINKSKPDNFALQTIFKELNVGYEYFVENDWSSDRPTQKPEGKRVIFDNVDRFRAARDVYFAWKTLSDPKFYSPVMPEETIKRLLKARQADYLKMYQPELARYPLWLFVPWGVRPEGEFGDPEKAVLNRLRSTQLSLWERDINAQVLIMPADLYATEVNQQVSNEQSKKYFETVTVWARLDFWVVPWSKIRQTHESIYRQRANELTEDEITKLLGPNIVKGAINASERRSGYDDEIEVRNAAFAYLRERVCEAEIIESIYRPVKVSAVSKSKDTGVDRNLPRLYLFPPELQFPWLK